MILIYAMTGMNFNFLEEVGGKRKHVGEEEGGRRNRERELEILPAFEAFSCPFIKISSEYMG